MNSKQMLIPLAAFAVAATSVNTLNPEMLKRVGLREKQIAAFEVAKELNREGNRNAARDLLAEAGIDLDILEEVRRAVTKSA